MVANSNIEWTDATWNPVTGCTEVSTGCDHCYAKTFAERFRGVPGHPYEQGFDLKLWPERVTLPLRWKKPRRLDLEDGEQDMAVADTELLELGSDRALRRRWFGPDSYGHMAKCHLGLLQWLIDRYTRPGETLPKIGVILPFAPQVTGMTEGNKVFEAIRFCRFREVSKTPNMMHVVLFSGPLLSDSALLAGVVIAFSGFLSLACPSWAVVFLVVPATPCGIILSCHMFAHVHKPARSRAKSSFILISIDLPWFARKWLKAIFACECQRLYPSWVLVSSDILRKESVRRALSFAELIPMQARCMLFVAGWILSKSPPRFTGSTTEGSCILAVWLDLKLLSALFTRDVWPCGALGSVQACCATKARSCYPCPKPLIGLTTERTNKNSHRKPSINTGSISVASHYITESGA